VPFLHLVEDGANNRADEIAAFGSVKLYQMAPILGAVMSRLATHQTRAIEPVRHCAEEDKNRNVA
jgi:hypothetical protein